jgi:AcrR family transcriptional regulator
MPRDTLTREQIVTAAIELMDAEGLDGLNMRALGRRLGSAATAVYWHVGSKANLIALAGDQAWGEVTLPDPAAVSWRTAAAAMATGLHAMLIRHPWVVQAFGSYPLFGPGKARHDDHLLAIYEAAGFPAEEADQATDAVCTYVLGNALGPAAAASLTRKLSRDGGDAGKRMGDTLARAPDVATQFPRLHARLETPTASYYAAPEHSFEFGLQAILDGLEAQLTVRHAAPGRNARKPSLSRPDTIPQPGAGRTTKKPPRQSERAR